MKRGFLIDMDGVIYRGGELIPGVREFLERLTDNTIPFLFLTNNSRRTQRDVAMKLNRLGIPDAEKHVLTCTMSKASYLARRKPKGTAVVVSEGGLITALH